MQFRIVYFLIVKPQSIVRLPFYNPYEIALSGVVNQSKAKLSLPDSSQNPFNNPQREL